MNFKTYSTQFWLLCLSSYFFFGSFNMIIPELPSFLTKLGGAEYKGLIISLFTLTAMISRPFSGKLADSIGRIPVMVIGSGVCLICSFIYPALSSVYGFFLLRFVHGFSTGFTPTGVSAYISDIIPVDRRGEAMGLLSTFGAIGMASAPAIGGWVAVKYSLDVMFYCSSAFGMLSMLFYLRIKETLHTKQSFQLAHLNVGLHDLYEPKAIIPFSIMVMSSYSFGAMLTLVPDLSLHLGIQNKGLIFTGFTLASVAVRAIGGRLSDLYGRRAILKYSTALIAIATITVGYSTSTTQLWIGGILYGAANGMNSPTLFAWVADVSTETTRGRAFAFIYIALELGIGLGAIVSGFVYANQAENIRWAFMVGSGLALLALLTLLYTRPRNEKV